MNGRRPSFDVAAALATPGFTPPAREVPALLDLLAGDEETARAAERLLLRAPAVAAPAVLARLPAAPPPARGRLVRLIGRLVDPADDPRLVAALVAALDDADPRTSRAAIVALGHRPGEESERELLARSGALAARAPEHHRALVDALGKVGGVRARDALRALDPGDDPELRRLLDRALLRLDRTLGRDEHSAIDASARLAAPTVARLLCRAGLEPILVEELPAAWKARASGRGEVTCRLSGPLDELLRARTWLRVGFPLAERRRAGEDAVDAVARALASDGAWAILRPLTRGAVRYRASWIHGGHRRAATLRLARAVTASRPELVNDPVQSTWEVEIAEPTPERIEVLLVPRRLEDPRFAYRRGDVPAASHPTIAAALARVAGARADDVVWDPFVGSGTELIERARLGPYRALHGSDLDGRALAVAHANLEAAGVPASLILADARAGAPAGVTLVLTNPPMGRRVLRGEDVGGLLDAVIEHVAAALAPGGRLVWISPLPARTAVRAGRAGLVSALRRAVDLGGVTAELQRWDKPTRGRAGPPGGPADGGRRARR